jgi:hypothetical protein
MWLPSPVTAAVDWTKPASVHPARRRKDTKEVNADSTGNRAARAEQYAQPTGSGHTCRSGNQVAAENLLVGAVGGARSPASNSAWIFLLHVLGRHKFSCKCASQNQCIGRQSVRARAEDRLTVYVQRVRRLSRPRRPCGLRRARAKARSERRAMRVPVRTFGRRGARRGGGGAHHRRGDRRGEARNIVGGLRWRAGDVARVRWPVRAFL